MTRCLALALIAVLARPAPSDACAPAPPHGEEVQIADEEAVIVWDAAHHVEHFIRRAGFHSTARAFGFLVPTPALPQLGEIDAGVFAQLADAIRPPVEVEDEWEPSCMLMMAGTKKGDEAGGAAPVHVLAAAHVAGFDATTIEADDPDAMASWLGAHGFDASPPLRAWLAGYVAARWKITAFVVASDVAAGAHAYDLATRAVHMTFATDRPMYPYREPAQPPAAGDRLFRLFFLSDRRYDATLGTEPWTYGHAIFAAPIEHVPTSLQSFTPEHAFATVFVEEGLRRGSDELFFVPSPTQRTIEQPTIHRVREHAIPLDLIVIVLAIVLPVFVLWRRRRRRSATA